MATLWVPESARPEPTRVLKCNAPGCDKRFPLEQRQQFERHIRACARKNIDAIQEATELNRDPMTEPFDKEMYGWVRGKASEVGPTRANKMLRGSKHGRKT